MLLGLSVALCVSLLNQLLCLLFFGQLPSQLNFATDCFSFCLLVAHLLALIDLHGIFMSIVLQ